MQLKKRHLHGVTKLIKAGPLSQLFKKLEYIQIFVISTESRDTDKEHVHFYLSSDDKKLNRSRVRDDIKRLGDLKVTKNGQFNIDKKVKDPIQTVIYLCKEGYPDYVHGIPIADMKDATRKSYSKKVSMTTAIQNLMKQVIDGLIDAQEYTVQYRLLRIQYKKPDPNWMRQYDNACEIIKTEEIIREEVSQLESNRRLFS